MKLGRKTGIFDGEMRLARPSSDSVGHVSTLVENFGISSVRKSFLQ